MSDARSSSDSHGLRQKLSSLSKGDLIEELIGALMKVTELSARPGSVAQRPIDSGALEDLISTFEQMRGYPEGDSNDPCFDLCGMPCCNEFGCLHAKVRAVRALAHSSTDKSGAA